MWNSTPSSLTNGETPLRFTMYGNAYSTAVERGDIAITTYDSDGNVYQSYQYTSNDSSQQLHGAYFWIPVNGYACVSGTGTYGRIVTYTDSLYQDYLSAIDITGAEKDTTYQDQGGNYADFHVGSSTIASGARDNVIRAYFIHSANKNTPADSARSSAGYWSTGYETYYGYTPVLFDLNLYYGADTLGRTWSIKLKDDVLNSDFIPVGNWQGGTCYSYPVNYPVYTNYSSTDAMVIGYIKGDASVLQDEDVIQEFWVDSNGNAIKEDDELLIQDGENKGNSVRLGAISSASKGTTAETRIALRDNIKYEEEKVSASTQTFSQYYALYCNWDWAVDEGLVFSILWDYNFPGGSVVSTEAGYWKVTDKTEFKFDFISSEDSSNVTHQSTTVEDEDTYYQIQWAPPTNPTRTGFKFLGWSTTKDVVDVDTYIRVSPTGDGKRTVIYGPFYGVNSRWQDYDVWGATTFYAVWASEDTSWDANGGYFEEKFTGGSSAYVGVDSGNPQIDYVYVEPGVNYIPSYWYMKVPEYQPRRDGYTFIGWFADKACTTQIPNTESGVTPGRTYYAGWIPDPVLVRYRSNREGEGVISEQWFYYNDIIAVEPDMNDTTGWYFNGWNVIPGDVLQQIGTVDDVQNGIPIYSDSLYNRLGSTLMDNLDDWSLEDLQTLVKSSTKLKSIEKITDEGECTFVILTDAQIESLTQEEIIKLAFFIFWRIFNNENNIRQFMMHYKTRQKSDCSLR